MSGVSAAAGVVGLLACLLPTALLVPLASPAHALLDLPRAVPGGQARIDEAASTISVQGGGASAGPEVIARGTPQRILRSKYWTAYLNLSWVDWTHHLWHTERSETGRYLSAGAVNAHGVAIELVSISRSDDNMACSPPFKMSYPRNEPWIAVVSAGGCPFDQKIRSALRLNASGVVIYDNESAVAFDSPKRAAQQFAIPAVFTYQWKGEEIINLTKVLDKVYIHLQRGELCRIFVSSLGVQTPYCTPDATRHDWAGMRSADPRWRYNVTSHYDSDLDSYHVEKRTSVLFVSVSFIVLMLISLAWLIFYYVQRFRYMHAKDLGS